MDGVKHTLPQDWLWQPVNKAKRFASLAQQGW